MLSNGSGVGSQSNYSADIYYPFDDAPVFEPTTEEFQDPILYIRKIRPEAEQYGICKIKPPQDWCPPFGADIDRFRFTPCITQVTGTEVLQCAVCAQNDGKKELVFCTLCDDCYHASCLEAQPQAYEDGLWWCPRCTKGEVQNPHKEVTLSNHQYSLSQFGCMADKFKAEYFGVPVAVVPSNKIEEEFWSLHASKDEEVFVEFGDNLNSAEYGSGFPVIPHAKDPPDTVEYCRSPWNFHNLPVLEGSVLRHVKDAKLHTSRVDVGMCFTTHGWSQEEHWLYCCSYLHWGESKTWYGVSGQCAVEFEKIQKQSHPTMTVQPDAVNSNGVPVYRIEQHAGEFIIVFPRAYHLCFSHGYNFAESVNFAPSDWLSLGSECEKVYAQCRRPSRFSHQEVLCRMACSWPRLDPALAPAVHQDLIQALQQNQKLSKNVADNGVTKSSKEMMEAVTWDERRCLVCHTVCFLSAITCPCQSESMVCLQHCKLLCSCNCDNYTMRYRYSEEDIPEMMNGLSSWVESLNDWMQRITQVFNCESPKEDLDTFKSLLSEAEEEHFPESETLQQLRSTVKEASQLAELSSQLGSKKVRTRTWSSSDAKVKLSLEELSSLCQRVKRLACSIPEADGVMALLARAEECRFRALDLLSQDLPDYSDLEECIEQLVSLDIHFSEIAILKQRIIQVEWLDEVHSLQETPEQVTMYALRRLISIGIGLPPHTRVEQALTELQVLLRSVEDWQERAKVCLDVKCRQHISVLELLLEEAKNIPAYLPNIGALHNVLKKGKEWIAKVEVIQASEDYPYLDTVERLVAAGRSIPLDLEQLPVLEAQVVGAKAWRDRTSRTFLRKNSFYTLIQALAPRTVVGVDSLSASKKQQHLQYQQLYQHDDMRKVDAAVVVSAFKSAEKQEMRAMRELRMFNVHKRARDTGNATYCICHRGISGFMLQCELCRDWFHATCVPLPKSPGSKSRLQTPAQQLAAAANREVKFLCPCCLRSRRPRLETILSLLVTMHKVPVRMPEGDALKCLTERAMNWQDRARQTLATDELSSALAKLSVLSQKLVEAAAREKTEKIISSELKKAANKPELGLNMMAIRTNHSSGVDRYYDTDEHGVSYSNSEHAYSSASKSNQGGSGNPGAFGGMKHGKHRGSMAAIDCHSPSPLLTLSDVVRAQLEELMMEGDLLEVSLDETQHIWRILQATKPRHHDKYPDVEDLENELLACKAEKDRIREEQKARKRRCDIESYSGVAKKMRVKYSKDFDKYDKFGRPRLKDKRRGMKKEMRAPRGIGRRRAEDRCFQTKRGKRGTSDDDVDECSARPCLHPVEREVDWVQCDGGCELWFHLFCLGLDKRDVKEDEDFICRLCQSRML